MPEAHGWAWMDFDERRGACGRGKTRMSCWRTPSEELRTYIRPQLTDGGGRWGKDIIR